MNNYWLKLLASFIFITVLPACWIGIEIYDARAADGARDGVIDLRGENLADGEGVRLNGTWQLYPGVLLPSAGSASSGSLSPAVPAPVAVRVPGIWNPLPELSAGLGTATYRLRLLLPADTDGIYGIRTTNIRTSNRIYVNGEKIGGSGRPGGSREETIAGNTPYVSYFRLQGPEAEVLVQVANYSYASGGIIYPVWFGAQEAIARGRELNLFEYWMTAGGFLNPALFLLLFFRLRGREAPLLQLGGFCVCSLSYVLTHGEKAALSLLPGLDYEWVLRVQLISSGFVYYFLARHLVQLFPKYSVRLLNRLMLASASALTVVGLLTPTYLFSRFEALLLVCSLLSIGYILYVLIRAVLAREAHTPALSASIQSVLCMLAVYLLHGFGKLEDQALLPYAIILFSASQAYLVVARFSNLLGHAERMSERLVRLDESKDEFMLATSYEIREPLRAIVNLTSSGEGRDEAQGDRQRLVMIAGMARQLTYLVDDMIDFSLLKNGGVAERKQTVRLESVVRSVLELYPPGTPSGWTVEPMPALPSLLADERRLGQIVYNLFAYAARHGRGADVRIWAEADNGRVTLAVAAPGIGMALEQERRAPEFGHRDETAAEAAERVRLSVTRQLIELGGGSWRADGAATLYVSWLAAAAPPALSQERYAKTGEGERAGKGAADAPRELYESGAKRTDERAPFPPSLSAEAVHGRLPGQESAVPLPTDAEAPAGGAILIVDDDLLAAEVMAHLLSGPQRSVRIAGGGLEALGLVKDAHTFDLIIADLVMPEMSGMELVRRIRERSPLAELPILLLCEGRLPEEALTGFRAGANDILVKPYDAAELQARVGTLLQLRFSVQSLVRTESAFLRAQIKPHFLFNALNTIMTICRLDPPKAEELLLQLSRYLRASFDFDHSAPSVPLRSELELVRSYLAIESARFENRLRVHYDIESDDLLLIPPLSIQPLVENAVRHGILRKPEGGTVQIGVKAVADGWKVSVEDDGVGITAQRLRQIGESGGVGLANLRRQLQLMYNETLHIRSRPGGGTQVHFLIPGSVEHESDID